MVLTGLGEELELAIIYNDLFGKANTYQARHCTAEQSGARMQVGQHSSSLMSEMLCSGLHLYDQVRDRQR
jgi:hypothetical protein